MKNEIESNEKKKNGDREIFSANVFFRFGPILYLPCELYDDLSRWIRTFT
jgi:hypothetical protein